MRETLSGLRLPLMLLMLLAVVSPAPAENSSDDMEQVVVSGEQPGPGLWKVSHGTHVLWIISNVRPAPKDIKWRSRQVEAIVAEADVILSGIEVSPNIGFFRAMRHVRAILRARFNPDQAVLKDLISPEEYARWLVLRKEYLGDDEDIEKTRPMLIALSLYGNAARKAGLTEREPTGPFVSKIARKHRVPSKGAELKVDIDDPKQLIKDFTATSRETELACFLGTLEHLQAEVEAMKLRANAWAVGDVEAFQKLPEPENRLACIKAMTSAPTLQGYVGNVFERYAAIWLAEAESALAVNEVSVGLLSLDDILREDGLLAKLRAKGYTVEGPSGPGT